MAGFQAYLNGRFWVSPEVCGPHGFRGVEYIRVGSYKKKLKEHPEKERTLWVRSERTPFETGIALRQASSEQLLSLLAYPAYFDLMRRPLPDSRQGILEGLAGDGLVQPCGIGQFHVTNLGAILFAKDLRVFPGLARKAVRVIVYDGRQRVKAIHRQDGRQGTRWVSGA